MSLKETVRHTCAPPKVLYDPPRTQMTRKPQWVEFACFTHSCVGFLRLPSTTLKGIQWVLNMMDGWMNRLYTVLVLVLSEI